MKRGITITPRLDADNRQLWAEPEYNQVFGYLANRLCIGGSPHVLEIVDAIDALIDMKPEDFIRALKDQERAMHKIKRARFELEDAETSMQRAIEISERMRQ